MVSVGASGTGSPERGPAVAHAVRVRVELAERGYDVVVGPGVRAEVASCLPPGARRATVVTQAGIGVELDPGVPFQVVTIPDGERASRSRPWRRSAGSWPAPTCIAAMSSWPSGAGS